MAELPCPNRTSSVTGSKIESFCKLIIVTEKVLTQLGSNLFFYDQKKKKKYMCLKFFKVMKNKIVEILEKKFQNWRVNHVVRKTSPTPLCQLQKFLSGNLQEHLLGLKKEMK